MQSFHCFQILQLGNPDIIPFDSKQLQRNLYRISFHTQKQILLAINQLSDDPNIKIYKRYKKFASCTQIPCFKTVTTTNNAVFLHSDESQIWVYGICNNGQMGIGQEKIHLKVPLKTSVFNNKKFNSFSVSEMNCVGIDQNEQLFIWGANPNCFDNSEQQKYILKPQNFLKKSINRFNLENQSDIENNLKFTIAQAYDFTYYFVYNNVLYSYGKEYTGRLGTGKTNIIYAKIPIQIQMPIDFWIIKGMSCGLNFTICWDMSGNIYSWGDASFGRLGQGCIKGTYNYIQSSPKKIEALAQQKIISACCGINHAIALTKEGNVYQWGHQYDEIINYKNRPNKIKNLQNIIKIQTKNNHNAALDKSGKLYQWGIQQIQFLEESENPKIINEIEKYKIIDFSLSVGFIVSIQQRFFKCYPQQQKKSLILMKSMLEILKPTKQNLTSKTQTQNLAIIYNSEKATETINEIYKQNKKKCTKSRMQKGFKNIEKKDWRNIINIKNVKSIKKKQSDSFKSCALTIKQNQCEQLQKIDNFLAKNKSKQYKKLIAKPPTKQQINETISTFEKKYSIRQKVIPISEKVYELQMMKNMILMVKKQYLVKCILNKINKQKYNKYQQNLKKINKYIKGIVQFKNMPKFKHTQQQFLDICIQQIIKQKLVKKIRQKIKNYRFKVQKVSNLFITYHQICKIIKSQINIILDYHILQNSKINKSNNFREIEKGYSQLKEQIQTIKRIKFSQTKLFLQKFKFKTPRNQLTNTVFPILPFSKYIYDIIFKDQSKFVHFKKQTKIVAELRTRQLLINDILKANIKIYIQELQEYQILKQRFILNNMQKINNERIRLLLSTKYVVNYDAEPSKDYLPFAQKIKNIAKTLQKYPKKPDLNLILLLNTSSKHQNPKKLFKDIMNRYVQIMLNLIRLSQP